MKYIEEFKDKNLAQGLISAIKKISKKSVNLMEVCGTHTVAISRSGIRNLMPENINLLSGPGCPVCVTSQEDIDKIISLSKKENFIITTFGDMMKVPGSYSSLYKEKSEGKDIRVVYSAMDSLKIAEENKDKNVVFLGVGFETTSPTIAVSILEAKKRGLKNFYIFCSHKLIPPAMKGLLDSGEVRIDGFICPGHVSTIIGSKPYEFIAKDYKIPSVITGFEPLDILQAIYILITQIENNKQEVEIQYKRVVKAEGNEKAKELLNEVFEEDDVQWRGLGTIPSSGLKLRKEFENFDVEKNFEIKINKVKEIKNCQCGEILKGIKLPNQCKLFAKVCSPENPVGPCMVSSEGACSAYYRFGGRNV